MVNTKSSSKKRKRVKVVDGTSLKSKKPLGIEEYPDLEPTAEELELEEAVFGFTPAASKSELNQKYDPTDSSSSLGIHHNKGLFDLPDDQLFILDEPNQSNGSSNTIPPEGKNNNAHPNREKHVNKPDQSLEKASVWKDASANQVLVSLTHGPNRRKKMRKVNDPDGNGEILISGEEYEKRLRDQFNKMHPTPNWLSSIRQSKANPAANQDEEEEGLGVDMIYNSTGDLSRQKISKKNGALPKDGLQVTRLRDANQAEPQSTQAYVSCLQFHPHSDILFTGSSKSKRLSFFKIDGTHNPALHFVHTPDLPIQAAEFCPASSTNVSSTVLITGNRPFFYTFDMQSCRCIKSPQGLFHKSIFSQSSKGTSLSHFKFSPQGNLVAFVGLNGLIELVDWSNNIASSQIVHSLKSNTPIKSLAWSRNGTELLTIGGNAEVSIWDLRMKKILGSWFDDGGFHPTKITTTDQDSYHVDQSYTAIGSQTGIVNLYSSFTVDDDTPDSQSVQPFRSCKKPFKILDNLTTSINRLKFNPDAQVLGISSGAKKDAFKLVHVKSGTIFPNWPTSKTPLGHVTDFDFSYNSKKLAISNSRGKVLLYSLNFWE